MLPSMRNFLKHIDLEEDFAAQGYLDKARIYSKYSVPLLTTSLAWGLVQIRYIRSW